MFASHFQFSSPINQHTPRFFIFLADKQWQSSLQQTQLLSPYAESRYSICLHNRNPISPSLCVPFLCYMDFVTLGLDRAGAVDDNGFRDIKIAKNDLMKIKSSNLSESHHQHFSHPHFFSPTGFTRNSGLFFLYDSSVFLVEYQE